MAKILPARNGSKKEVILKSAALLFRSRGYKASSMRELALQLNIEAPSLYNHIGSKTELLESICFWVADQFAGHLQEVQATDDSAIAKLERLIRFHIHTVLHRFDELYISNHEWKHLPQVEQNRYLAARQDYEAGMLAIIKAGVKNKELKEVNPQIALITILAALRGLEHGQRLRQAFNSGTLEEQMVEHLLNGITK